MALKSTELPGVPFETHITAIRVDDGDVIMEDTLIPTEGKFEGIEFTTWNREK